MSKLATITMKVTLKDLTDLGLEGIAWDKGLIAPGKDIETEFVSLEWDNETQTGIATIEVEELT